MPTTAAVVAKLPKCPKCKRQLYDYDPSCGFGRCKVCGSVDLQAGTTPRVKGGVTRETAAK